MSQITILTDVWMITFMVPSSTGISEKMLVAANDAGAAGAFGYNARGYGVRERLGAIGLAVETERDVFHVMVSTEQRDIVFEAMYQAGELGTPGAGLMFVTPLEKVATFVPEAALRKAKEIEESRQAQ